MRALFLADTHIRGESDPAHGRLLAFLEHARGAHHLFVLGDFFDFWFCDRRSVYPGFRLLVNRLLDLQKQGTQVHLFEGNHDFYLDDYFAGTGISVYPADADFTLDSKRLLLAHGDLVDTDNRKYLFLRRVLRSPLFYRFQKIIPPKLRWSLARFSSRTSGRFPEPREALAARMEEYGRAKLQKGYDAVILGHCHVPLLREFPAGEKKGIFCTLGDWVTHFTYLEYTDGAFRLSNWK